ncbi:MAG: DUF3460 family protein [Casimicrobiaceae bacterium]|nr:DUF3460 family protein [Casimicrobiaceae bacterium]MCX8097580.1 DUF3460 family protein [Casimicrobiaceae bacterium]MDW8312084.1 DUF3460 family protein [Burkholderiales bacterium]
MYESDITQFLRQLKAERPKLEEAQRQGRAIWWDRPPIDVEERLRVEASRLPQPPYPYFSWTSRHEGKDQAG